MARTKKEREKIRNTSVMVGGGALIVILVIMGSQFGWLAGAPSTPVTYDYYEIALYDAYDISEDNYELDNDTAILWYSVDISNLDSEEIADLTFTDYTYEEADENIDIDEDKIFIAKIFHQSADGDFLPKYYSTTSLVFDGKMPSLVPGLNNIYLTNTTADVSMLAYGKDSLDNTIAETTEANWMVLTQCLDGAEGTGEGTDLEGYTPYFDPENNVYQRPIIRITFNTTASASYCRLMSSYVNVETSVGVYLYIAIDAILVDQNLFEIKFSASALCVTVNVTSIDVGYGSADSFTSWDSQV